MDLETPAIIRFASVAPTSLERAQLPRPEAQNYRAWQDARGLGANRSETHARPIAREVSSLRVSSSAHGACLA